MHRAFSYFLALSLVNSTLSLKLLTASDENGDGDDYTPLDIPEEWEADIQFSYKPIKGKCKADSGKVANIAAANSWTAKKLCNINCAASTVNVPAAVKTKYCSGSKTFNQIYAAEKAAMAANPPTQKLSKCPHLVAKWITMGNTEDECTKQKASSFAIKAVDCDLETYKGSGAEEGTTDDGWFCYTKAGIEWAKNDPKVKNMDGEEFDIMATGTFTLLSLQKTDSTKTGLEVVSTIDRAGTRCGATYIQNITLRGQWVEDVGFAEIKVRAVPAVPKKQALEANFDGSWRPSSSHWTSASVQQATATKFNLKINEVGILVSVDAHRIHEDGVKTKRFANFLNVNFDGVSKLSGVSIRGLLGRDSHAEAAELPEGCASSSLLSSPETKTISSATVL